MYKEIDYNKTLGIYKPSFFYMELGVETEFEDILKNKSSESVFFHEYIHFLQDVLTIYGINNTRSNFLLLQNAISFMQGIRKTLKYLPLEIKSKHEEDFRKIFEYTYGINDRNTFNMLNKCSRIVDLERKEERLNNNLVVIYNVFLDGIKSPYQLGARDIKESMAYLLQKWVYGNDIPNPPVCPYKTIEMLADYCCPASFPEKIYLIALCELSLQCANPMMFFMETLDIFSKENYIPNNITEFGDKIMSGKKIECNGIEYSDCKSLYNSIADDLIDQLHVLFKDDFFSKAMLWLNKLLGNAKQMVSKETLSITMLFISNGVSNFHEIVTSILGAPIIYIKDKKTGYFFNVYEASGDLYFLRVLERFRDSLYYGTSCWLDEYCKEIFKNLKTYDHTDNNCREHPTKRKQQNCPFVYICNLFGLPEDVEFCNYFKKPNFA